MRVEIGSVLFNTTMFDWFRHHRSRGPLKAGKKTRRKMARAELRWSAEEMR